MNDFIDDNDAWKFLEEKGFKKYSDVIYEPKYKLLTKDEKRAIDYLINEWDWDYAMAYSHPI